MKRKVNPLIQAINEASNKTRREAHEMINKAKTLDQLRMKIRVNYSPIFKDLDLSVHNLYLRTGYYKPTIEVTLNKLESFKDDQLVKLLSFLTDRASNMTSKDYASWLNRDFSFELEDVYVNISAYVRSDSPTCRKVQVGVTVQEVAEYELVCD